MLTDLQRFREWNPFIRSAEGSTELGGTVGVHVRSSFGLPLAFHATVLESHVNRELHWQGHVVAPWLACGEHWSTIEPQGRDQRSELARVDLDEREVLGAKRVDLGDGASVVDGALDAELTIILPRT